jgi:hypothetical protein
LKRESFGSRGNKQEAGVDFSDETCSSQSKREPTLN